MITELAFSFDGLNKLNQNKLIEALFNYTVSTEDIKHQKACIWMLAKICSNESTGSQIERQIQMIDWLVTLERTTDDLSLKGTVINAMSLIGSIADNREKIESFDWYFLFNSNVCFPNKFNINLMDSSRAEKSSEISKKINTVRTLFHLDKVYK